jgi:hypothetical protein
MSSRCRHALLGAAFVGVWDLAKARGGSLHCEENHFNRRPQPPRTIGFHRTCKNDSNSERTAIPKDAGIKISIRSVFALIQSPAVLLSSPTAPTRPWLDKIDPQRVLRALPV